LLVAMLVVGAFFGGVAWQRQADEPYIVLERRHHILEEITLRDGTIWVRVHDPQQVKNQLMLPDGTGWIRVLEPKGLP
jgi:hypothetical protein